ncbi:methyltransferase [Pectobacterium carotovorum subsp. carotovorum]|nr:methyltransferase [Pectobacterium carotovorum subsp. carotovorum]
MGNKSILDYYDGLAKKIKNPIEMRNKAKDSTRFDVDLMKSYASSERSLLDLGSGTGLLVNELVSDYKNIVAVEKYRQFSDFILVSDNVKVINEDILELKTTELYDVISVFGVMPYFNQEEAKKIYSLITNSLRKSVHSVAVIKHQMGVDCDVTVNGWSEELNAEYYSEYRYVENEIALLHQAGFTRIDKLDIYPSEFNRWSNTHFYALVCRF